MKAMVINASPRKGWNTAQVLQATRDGAAAAGIETEYVDLYDKNYTGCRSCLTCKKKNIINPCKCYWKDDLSDLLDRIYQVDHLFIGSPLYYSEPTSAFRALFERLIFPAMSYQDYGSQLSRAINVDLFFTMNRPLGYYKENYENHLLETMKFFHLLNGEVRIFPICDTMQVFDYNAYDMAALPSVHKRELHDKEFQKTLEKAYQIGYELNK